MQYERLLTIRFVLCLYRTRCPHSLQRMGSLGLTSFKAAQSVAEQERQDETIVRVRNIANYYLYR